MDPANSIEGEKGRLLERQKVEDLKRKLQEFAKLDTSSREKELINLSNFIGETLTDQFVAENLVMSEVSQEKIRRAAEAASATKFEVNGKQHEIWDSGYTVAALDADGNVLGLVYKPTPRLKEYGYLGPYALRKAVIELHLDKAGKKGGLSSNENFEYISSLGLTAFEEFFTGSVSGPIDIGFGPSFIGGSGCAVKDPYLSDLLSGATPGPETLAGLFDSEFCKLTAGIILNPEIQQPIIPEPTALREIRILN